MQLISIEHIFYSVILRERRI